MSRWVTIVVSRSTRERHRNPRAIPARSGRSHSIRELATHRGATEPGATRLYAEEFIRDAERSTATTDDRSKARQEIVGTRPSIHALLASRLDAMPADLKADVQDAVGRRHGRVAGRGRRRRPAVRGPTSCATWRPWPTDRWSAAPRTSSVKDQDEFVFRHVLVREVAYGQIPRAERARKHAAVAVVARGGR